LELDYVIVDVLRLEQEVGTPRLLAQLDQFRAELRGACGKAGGVALKLEKRAEILLYHGL
jgi:hypothetical protein